MAPFDPRDPSAWSDLAGQWRDAGQAWLEWWGRAQAIPASTAASSATSLVPEVATVQADYQSKLSALWRAALSAPGTDTLPEIVAPAPGDRRFKAGAWHREPFYSLVMQSYLIYAQYLRQLAHLAPLPPAERKRLEFATRQYLDAIAPSNFPATNPDVLAQAVRTEGESLVRGMRNLAEDAQKGRITMTDERAFEVGRNIATTPGSVVFRNELIEIIQYDATTPTVAKRPLVIVPPCINKFYILDLAPGNSFVAHAVALFVMAVGVIVARRFVALRSQTLQLAMEAARAKLRLAEQDALLLSAQRVADGDLDTPIAVSQDSSLQSLAEGLNRLREDVRTRLRQLSAKNVASANRRAMTGSVEQKLSCSSSAR